MLKAKGHIARGSPVLAGFTRAERNGTTEGQITRLKLIKRSMYGRANFDLLRIRVLSPPHKKLNTGLYASSLMRDVIE
jgi:hypothetical protein